MPETSRCCALLPARPHCRVAGAGSRGPLLRVSEELHSPRCVGFVCAALRAMHGLGARGRRPLRLLGRKEIEGKQGHPSAGHLLVLVEGRGSEWETAEDRRGKRGQRWAPGMAGAGPGHRAGRAAGLFPTASLGGPATLLKGPAQALLEEKVLRAQT